MTRAAKPRSLTACYLNPWIAVRERSTVLLFVLGSRLALAQHYTTAVLKASSEDESRAVCGFGVWSVHSEIRAAGWQRIG